MAVAIKKMVPTLTMVGLVGYCCWPYLGRPTPEAARDNPKPPEVARTLLAPTLAPVPQRDPFGMTAPTPAKESPSTKPPPSANPPAAAIARADLTSLLSGLTLNATLIRGSRRVALINGRSYAEGDKLTGSGSTTSACVVARVYPDKVVLDRQGQTVELKYANTSSKSASSLPAKATAKTSPASRGR